MRFRPTLLLPLVAALAVLPLAVAVLASPAPERWLDLRIYSEWLALFSEQVWRGDLYPRWLYAANGGEGSPAFVFYGPLTFWLSALLQPLAAFDPHGVGRLLLMAWLAFAVSGWGCFRWLREHAESRAALLGACVYMLAPYHLTDLYFRAALPELWALALLPWALRAAESMRPVLGGWLALLLLTHLPTFLVAMPLVAACAGRRGPFPWRFLAEALALAAGTTAMYWLPAARNGDAIDAGYYLGSVYHYSRNFLSWSALTDLGVIPRAALAWGYVATLVVAAWVCRARGFWFVIILGAGFMAFGLSAWLWALLPPLAYVQFPWRFLLLTCPALAAICTRIPAGRDRRIVMLLAAGCLVLMPLDGAGTVRAFLAAPPHPLHAASLEARWIPTPEYRTRWQPKGWLDAEAVVARMHQPPVVARSEGSVTFRKTYFPGWKAEDTASGAPLAVSPSPEGYLVVTLPPGVREIRLSFGAARGEMLGLGTSALSLVAFLVLVHRWNKGRMA